MMGSFFVFQPRRQFKLSHYHGWSCFVVMLTDASISLHDGTKAAEASSMVWMVASV